MASFILQEKYTIEMYYELLDYLRIEREKDINIETKLFPKSNVPCNLGSISTCSEYINNTIQMLHPVKVGGKLNKRVQTGGFSLNKIKRFFRSCILNNPNQVAPIPIQFPSHESILAWSDPNSSEILIGTRIEIYAYVSTTGVPSILPIVIIQPDNDVIFGKPIQPFQNRCYIKLNNHSITGSELEIITKMNKAFQIPVIENMKLESQIKFSDKEYLLTFKPTSENSEKDRHFRLFTIPMINGENMMFIRARHDKNNELQFERYLEISPTDDAVNKKYFLYFSKIVNNFSVKLESEEYDTNNIKQYSLKFSYDTSTMQMGGSSKEYITILGKKRLVKKQGRTKYITYKGELMKLSEAKKLAKNKNVAFH